jgi:tungstate transport system ATP-binding protein
VSLVIIETKNLSKKYGDKYAVRDVNLSIRKGEIFAIMGSSGAGKTTILRLLNLLEDPSSGEIYFEGRRLSSIRGSSRLELRRRMALVAQGAPVFNASVYENVAYGLKVRGVARGQIEEKVKKALQIVGLAGYEKRNAQTLSGGEMQRVAFAMATVFEPDILFLDEPTANLDPIRESAIEEIILRIKGMGITVVLATHKQKEAISLADHIAVLNQGGIEQIGTPEEIFYKPKTKFVADFVGTENVIEGIIESSNRMEAVIRSTQNYEISAKCPGLKVGDRVNVCIRPEEIMILREDIPINPLHKNIIRATIDEILPHGGAMFRLRLKNPPLVVDVPRHVVEKMALCQGKEIKVSLKSSACHVIKSLAPDISIR